MRFSSTHLLSLINSVLDLSSIESGKVAAHPTPCDTVRTVLAVVQSFEVHAAEKGIALHCNIDPPTIAPMMLDKVHLKQIVYKYGAPILCIGATMA